MTCHWHRKKDGDEWVWRVWSTVSDTYSEPMNRGAAINAKIERFLYLRSFSKEPAPKITQDDVERAARYVDDCDIVQSWGAMLCPYEYDFPRRPDHADCSYYCKLLTYDDDDSPMRVEEPRGPDS